MKSIKLITFVILLFFVSCSPKNVSGCHQIIYLCNESDHEVYIWEYGMRPPSVGIEHALVKPHSCNKLIGASGVHYLCWEYRLERWGGQIFFEVCSPDTVAKYGVDRVISEGRFLQVDTLTLADLERSNWHVYYPRRR